MGIIEVMVTAATIPAVAFPFYYLTLPWYSTAPGRAVFVMSVCLALVMSAVFAAEVLETPFPFWLRVVVYVTISVGLWVKFGTLLYVSRPGYKPFSTPDKRIEV